MSSDTACWNARRDKVINRRYHAVVAADVGGFSLAVSVSVSARPAPSRAVVSSESAVGSSSCLESTSTPTPQCLPHSVDITSSHNE